MIGMLRDILMIGMTRDILMIRMRRHSKDNNKETS